MRSIPAALALLLATTTLASAAPIRILSPADDSTVRTGEPLFEVCVDGASSAEVRDRVEIKLDGDRITSLFDWDGECASWRFSSRPRALELRSWALRPLDDDEHTLLVTLEDDAGDETDRARSRFTVQFRRKATRLIVGASDASISGLGRPLASVNQLELSRGRTGHWPTGDADDVVRHEAHGYRIGAISTSLWGGDPDRAAKVDTTLRHIGELDRTGYGYRVGSGSAILPYHSKSIFAGRASIDTTFDDPIDPGQASDRALLAPFDREWRLELATGAGIAFQIGPTFELDVGYERAQLYPHLVFWEALGSAAVHAIAIDAADNVTQRMLRRAPRAAPIVDFLLKNAISYAVYEQRKDEMNWPFSGPAPLEFETWRVSFALTLPRAWDR